MNAKLPISDDTLRDFCRRWRITELSLFGSALRDDFGPDSDIGMLVRFASDAAPTRFDMVRMQDELVAITGRDVDLISRRAIEGSRNTIRRRAILGSAEVIYAA